MKQRKPRINGRFYVEYVEGEESWQVVDTIDGTLIGHETKREAQDTMKFARQYVKLHGDIDFCTFPYSLSESLQYDKYDGREREYLDDLMGENEAK